MTSEEPDTLENRRQLVKETLQEYDENDPDMDASEAVFEVADSCVPIYNHDIMDVAAAPDVWARDLEIEPQENTLLSYAQTAIFEALREYAYEVVEKEGLFTGGEQ